MYHFLGLGVCLNENIKRVTHESRQDLYHHSLTPNERREESLQHRTRWQPQQSKYCPSRRRFEGSLSLDAPLVNSRLVLIWTTYHTLCILGLIYAALRSERNRAEVPNSETLDEELEIGPWLYWGTQRTSISRSAGIGSTCLALTASHRKPQHDHHKQDHTIPLPT